MGYRSERKRRRASDAVETKARNRVFKSRERIRRDARMLETVRAGNLPYAPAVMSWLSRQLDKRASAITMEDVKTLLA